jgi:hypothetical protein
MFPHDTRRVRIDPEHNLLLVQSIRLFWNDLQISGDTKATTWRALEPIERQVTEHLDRAGPGDVGKAWSLTAQALCLMTGSEADP